MAFFTKFFAETTASDQIDGRVDTYADLPDAGEYNSEIWLVTTTTGIPFFNQREAGLYTSNGSTWTGIGAVSEGFLVESDVGVYVQAYSLRLTEIAALTPTLNSVIVGNGSSWINTTTPTFTGLTLSGLTASRLLASDGSKGLVSLDTLTYPGLTEISHVKGVTSSIQNQLDAITGSYVTSITGTANQVIASASTGAVTLSLPQDITPTSDVTFRSLATTQDATIGNGLAVFGNATFDNNNIATSIAVHYTGTVPISAATTGGVEYNHGFTLANDVTNIYAHIITPNVTPNFHTAALFASSYIAAGAVTGAGTITDGFGQVIDNPGFGTNKWSLWSKGRLTVGTSKGFEVGLTGAIEACTSITATGNISLTGGELTINQNNAFSNNGLAAEFYGTVPGRSSGGSPWSVLNGMGLYHNFSIQDSTTYIAELEISPTFTIPNATTLSDAFGVYIRAGTGALTGTGNATRYTNLNVEEPSFGTTKYAAKFFGATSVGTLGQFNVSRLGVVSTADGTFLGVGNTPTVDIHAFRNSANPIIGVQRNGFSIFGMQTDSDNGMRLGVYSGSDISSQLYIAKNGNITLGTSSSNQITLNNATSTTANTTAGGSTLPALAAAYITITINGVTGKIPFYAN